MFLSEDVFLFIASRILAAIILDEIICEYNSLLAYTGMPRILASKTTAELGVYHL